jgi:hypothetical protein
VMESGDRIIGEIEITSVFTSNWSSKTYQPSMCLSH